MLEEMNFAISVHPALWSDNLFVSDLQQGAVLIVDGI